MKIIEELYNLRLLDINIICIIDKYLYPTCEYELCKNNAKLYLQTPDYNYSNYTLSGYYHIRSSIDLFQKYYCRKCTHRILNDIKIYIKYPHLHIFNRHY